MLYAVLSSQRGYSPSALLAGCFCRLQGISDDCIKEASPHPSGWAMPFLYFTLIFSLLYHYIVTNIHFQYTTIVLISNGFISTVTVSS